MSESEKPEADFSETNAVVVDGDGNPRVRMESLRKSGEREPEGSADDSEQ